MRFMASGEEPYAGSAGLRSRCAAVSTVETILLLQTFLKRNTTGIQKWNVLTTLDQFTGVPPFDGAPGAQIWTEWGLRAPRSIGTMQKESSRVRLL